MKPAEAFAEIYLVRFAAHQLVNCNNNISQLWPRDAAITIDVI